MVPWRKRQVLDWMKRSFPGIREAGDDETMFAVEFVYEGEIKAYKTANGKTVHLAEIVEQ